MCKNWHTVRNLYTGKYVLTSCGHCPACLQQKAYKRTTRIDLQDKYDVPSDSKTLFVTLTYDNDCIPFIFQSDWDLFINGDSCLLPIYRNSRRLKSRQKDRNGQRVYETVKYDTPKVLDLVPDTYLTQDYLKSVDDFELPKIRYTYFRNGHRKYRFDSQRCGIIYYRDVQNFIKRFRIRLNRLGYDFKVHFFCTSEYGPTSTRPHFHLLLHFPKRYTSLVKDTIVKSWLFDNLDNPVKQQKQIKDAIDASNYVSSYVNCVTSLPPVLRYFKPFRPSHSYSQGYGMASSFTALDKILQMSEKRRFTFVRNTKINGVPTNIVTIIPAYVINRYFPIFKGYNRITPYELCNIIQLPCMLGKSKFGFIQYTEDDIRKISVSLRNHALSYCETLGLPFNDLTIAQYAYDFVSVWKRYLSFKTIFAYENVKGDEDLLYHYTNWYEYRKKHPIVRDIVNRFGLDSFEPNYNNFPETEIKHFRLEKAFYDYDKSRKVKNDLYSLETNI